MYKLPTTPKNIFRHLNKTHARRMSMLPFGSGDPDHVVEFAIPGLMDPTTVTVNMEYVEGKLVAVVRGEILNEELSRKGVWRVQRSNIAPFAEVVEIPAGAVNPAPKAVLTVAKDTCGNIDGGTLRLEWQTTTSQVPVEIKDCSPTD